MKDKYLSFTTDKKKFVYSGHTGCIYEIDQAITREQVIDYDSMNLQIKNKLKCENIFPDKKPFIKYLTLFLTYDCNLECAYCYEKELKVQINRQMQLDTFKKIIQYIFDNFQYSNIIHIHFFGGEPLMYFNVLKKCVAYLQGIENKDLSFVYTITTNGTLLNESIIDYLNDKDFGVNISIDGDRDSHNKYRIFKNSQNGSYDTIFKNLNSIKDTYNIDARVTITSDNFNFVEITDGLLKVGFNKIYFELVSDSSSEIFRRELLSARIKDLAEYYLEQIKRQKIVRITILILYLETYILEKIRITVVRLVYQITQ